MFESIERGKWIYDGCTTLDEMIGRLQSQIEIFREMKSDGITVLSEVEDDYAFLICEDSTTAKKWEFGEREDFEDEEFDEDFEDEDSEN